MKPPPVPKYVREGVGARIDASLVFDRTARRHPPLRRGAIELSMPGFARAIGRFAGEKGHASPSHIAGLIEGCLASFRTECDETQFPQREFGVATNDLLKKSQLLRRALERGKKVGSPTEAVLSRVEDLDGIVFAIPLISLLCRFEAAVGRARLLEPAGGRQIQPAHRLVLKLAPLYHMLTGRMPSDRFAETRRGNWYSGNRFAQFVDLIATSHIEALGKTQRRANPSISEDEIEASIRKYGLTHGKSKIEWAVRVYHKEIQSAANPPPKKRK